VVTVSDQYVGEIRMFAGDYAPMDWALCDGSELSISEYEVLYTLIGTTYGGDGVSTFKLPDLRGRVALHKGRSTQSGTAYTLGQAGGAESVTLTTAQLPTHSHAPQAKSLAGDSPSPTGAFWAAGLPYASGEPNGALSGTAVAAAGGNQAHDNVMPFLVVNFIIAVNGLFPSQQ
jgi:microcystin-dependent protein